MINTIAMIRGAFDAILYIKRIFNFSDIHNEFVQISWI